MACSRNFPEEREYVPFPPSLLLHPAEQKRLGKAKRRATETTLQAVVRQQADAGSKMVGIELARSGWIQVILKEEIIESLIN